MPSTLSVQISPCVGWPSKSIATLVPCALPPAAPSVETESEADAVVPSTRLSVIDEESDVTW